MRFSNLSSNPEFFPKTRMSIQEEARPTSPAVSDLVPGSRPKRSRKFLEIVLAFAVLFALMFNIEFAGPAILDNDGYYHIRWSKMLRESAPRVPEFKWLPLTKLNERDYADHHFLFHVLLIPFTFGDLRLGAKLAAAVFSSLALTTLFALLVLYAVRFRWLWLILLAASSQPFLYRMSMTRAPSLSIVLLGIGCYLILERKRIPLALLSFAFVWAYSLFPLLLGLALAYSAAIYVSERRVEFKTPLASITGLAAGLVINPYFPKNLSLIREHLEMKLSSTYPVEVGVEWYPYETWALAEWSGLALAVFFAALFAFDFKQRARDVKPLFFLVVSTIFLLMLLRSRRFVEYFPPFAVLFAAFTITPKLIELKLTWCKRALDRTIASTAAALATAVLIVWTSVNVRGAYTSMREETDPAKFKSAAQWLVENTPADSMVFNTDWDHFPMLFYYDTHNKYVTGLDPTYLYDRDPELWKVYERVAGGDEKDAASIIRDRFYAEYVVTENRGSYFMRSVEASGAFETVYSDRDVAVLRIRGD